jgi:hypothetical protein
MKCEMFSDWLENRDMHDVSEGDRALKHTESCEHCRDLYQKDECLNLFLEEKMTMEPIPERLKNQIDLNLDRQGFFEKTNSSLWAKAVPLALAAMLVMYLLLPFSQNYEALDMMGGNIVADHLHHTDNVMIVRDLDELQAYCASELNLAVSKPNMPANYKFIGARVCPLGDHSSVHLSYMADGKRVSLYIVKAEETLAALKAGDRYEVVKSQHNIKFWREQDKIYALIT